EAWGGYVITWVNNQGQPTDLEGNLLTDAELSFDLRNIRCEEKSHEEKIAVTNHDGITEWVSRITKTTFLDTIIRTGQHGIVSANCTARVVQDIWVDLDDCGFGTITRRFYITSGCGDNPQQLEAT